MLSPQPEEFRLLVTGGGTGGHTYPALTTVRALTARLATRGVATRVVWAGSPDGLEATVAASEGIRFEPLATGKVRRGRSPWGMLTARNARDMVQVARGVVQARSIVNRFQPDVVLSTGGYAAVPIGVAARHLRRPLVVHEQTVRLGLANRVLVRGATIVAISESSSLDLLPPRIRERTMVTGNPVRPELMAGEPTRAITALDLHAFDPGKPVVYVTGGAQGAVQINRLVSESLPWLLERANVIHQCGSDNVEALAERAADLPAQLTARYRALGFITHALPDVLALADLVVSRSGAGTIAELTALGKASVLVPLASSAGDEQAHNARRLRDIGAAVVLEGDVAPAQLTSALGPLLAGKDRRQSMAQAARAHGRPDAAERLVDVLLEAADPARAGIRRGVRAGREGRWVRRHPLWNPYSTPSEDEINAARAAFGVWKPSPVVVVAPDPEWLRSYEVLRDRVVAALGDRVLAIEHVGSTAVAGLWAKPLIDIDLTVADSANEDAWLPDLEAAGFELRVRESDPEEHRVLRGLEPTGNLHVFSPGAREPRRHTMFRDWLRAHPEDRDRYAQVKRAVAARGFTDQMLYNNAKAWFVYDLYERIFAADHSHEHDPQPRE